MEKYGSKQISLGTLPVRTYELDPNEEYILVCRSGAEAREHAKFYKNKAFGSKTCRWHALLGRRDSIMEGYQCRFKWIINWIVKDLHVQCRLFVLKKR